MLATGCYRHADTSKPIPFDSPRRADSNETLPDSGGHLPAEVSALFTLRTSIAMRTLRNLYHSTPLGERTPMRRFPTLADICLFHPADPYSHADASKPILFDSPRPADSNAPCPDAVRPLAKWLYILLYLSSPGKYFPIVGYWVLQACGRFEAYTIRFPSASGLQ